MYYQNNKDSSDINTSSIPTLQYPRRQTQLQVQQQQQYAYNNSFNELPTDYVNSRVGYIDFVNDPLFENANWGMGDFVQNQPSTMNPQDAILLSDPHFLRQHQLLQMEGKEVDPLLQDDMTFSLNDFNPTNDTVQKGTSHDQPLSVPEIDESKIDHQRRFNELQARFRVKQPSSNKKGAPGLSSSVEIPKRTEFIAMTTPPPMIATTKEDFFNSPQEQPLSSSFPSRTMPIQIQRAPRPHSQHLDAESYQKQLDSQLDKVDFDDITVAELKEMLRQRGKPATGRKSVLVQRLQEERDNGRNRTKRHSFPLMADAPKSYQEPTKPSFFLPLGSPGSQLSRSISNMHIGSPPANASRRYSPYSPRSPKLPMFELSTSDSMSNSAVNQAQSPTVDLSRLTPGRYYNNTKSYKPFTSSALATPDREEEVNPFDAYYENNKEDDYYDSNKGDSSNQTNWLGSTSFDIQDGLNMSQPVYSDSYSNDQLLALFNSPFDFKLDESVLK